MKKKLLQFTFLILSFSITTNAKAAEIKDYQPLNRDIFLSSTGKIILDRNRQDYIHYDNSSLINKNGYKAKIINSGESQYFSEVGANSNTDNEMKEMKVVNFSKGRIESITSCNGYHITLKRSKTDKDTLFSSRLLSLSKEKKIDYNKIINTLHSCKTVTPKYCQKVSKAYSKLMNIKDSLNKCVIKAKTEIKRQLSSLAPSESLKTHKIQNQRILFGKLKDAYTAPKREKKPLDEMENLLVKEVSADDNSPFENVGYIRYMGHLSAIHTICNESFPIKEHPAITSERKLSSKKPKATTY